MKAKIMSRPQ